MTEDRTIVCIACPIGCRLEVTVRGEAIGVTGNRCPKGELYGREEVLSPRRVVTGVVRTDSPLFPYAPIRTDAALPRALIGALMSALAEARAPLPLRTGERFLTDFQGTGVNVVFSRTLPPDEVPPVG
jgi:CxxC motif-containing protein